MKPVFADVSSDAICAFHDRRIADKESPQAIAGLPDDGVWKSIALNHRCNVSLWDEEDQARRTDVGAEAIAANKRAIDRFNQQRNDAVEKLDEALLARIAAVPIGRDAWQNSETAGAIVDRLSILALKVFHMRVQTQRTDVAAAHIEACTEKLQRLEMQRNDLGRCLDTLLTLASEGRAFWRVYRQFKMYNSPDTNPYLYGGRS
jgi:Protein of unknown function (DUF4254)